MYISTISRILIATNVASILRLVFPLVMMLAKKFEDDVILKPFLRDGLLDLILIVAKEEVASL